MSNPQFPQIFKKLQNLLVFLILIGCQSVVDTPPSDFANPDGIISTINSPTETNHATQDVSATPPPSQIPELDILKIHGYTDNYGIYHVSGLLRNNTAQTVENIELEIEIMDPDGGFLHSEIITTFLYSLPTAEITPFALTVNNPLGNAASAVVTVVRYRTSELKQLEVEIRGSTLTIDDNGNIHVTGELFNSTNSPALINGLAAATFDSDWELLTADSLTVGSRYLDPGEAGPFRVTMTGASGGVAEIGEFLIFVDSVAVPPQKYYYLQISESQHYYMDGFDSFHLVGEIINDSDQPLSVELVAAIFDEGGRIIDVASSNLPLEALAAGSNLPFDFNLWGPLNFKSGFFEKATRYSVQWDPYLTQLSETEYVDLTIENGTESIDEKFVVFRGFALNESGDDLTNAIVIIQLIDPNNGQLIAMDYETLFENLPSGRTFAYEIEIELEPGIDINAVQIKVLAKGKLPKSPT